MKISQLIAGIIMIIGGIALAIGSFFSTLFFLVYSAILIILGIFILFNKNEDKIEERRDVQHSANLASREERKDLNKNKNLK